jgi:heptosyltransferase-2
MSGKRYLIVRVSALGDVVMMSTLVAEIRRRDPGAHITWLCGSRLESLVGLLDVDQVTVVDELALFRGGAATRAREVAALWLRLGRQSFDETLLGHADSRYRMLLAPVRTGRLRALELGVSPRTLPIPGRYFGDELVRLLDDEDNRGPIVGHYPLAELRGPLPVPPHPETIGIVLAPGGTRNVLRENALRRWPVGRYRALAEQLLADGYGVTLVGDEGDAWVRPHFAGLDVRDEIGRHEIPGTLGLLALAELVIVHDTGVLHLARLARTPVIALFGPTMPTSFFVEAPDAVALWGGADLACRPCYNGREYAACANNVCIQEIEVADVRRHVSGLVAARRRSRAPGAQRPQIGTPA